MAKINPQKPLKIAITGPESTGKTQLVKQLAAFFNTVFVPEYARTYVEKLKRPYNYIDVLHIARKQIELEEEQESKARGYLFLDTELIITKVWLDVAYGYCPEWIDSAIRQSNIDLYLLCNLDIPWVEDSVRENGGDMRKKLFQIYEQLLRDYKLKYMVIAGTGGLRLHNAISAIHQFCSTRHIVWDKRKGI
jgi:NadR type nicotinamide-nucleotide adenylyltransferase